MFAKSKSQQRLFGTAKAYRDGKLREDKVSAKVKRLADTVPYADLVRRLRSVVVGKSNLS